MDVVVSIRLLRMKPSAMAMASPTKGRKAKKAIGFKVERLPGPPGGKREILRGRKEEVIMDKE
jgi:tRNA U34 5-methylaminomethyl-2-thiouridine-forming methyltransferase MnmC